MAEVLVTGGAGFIGSHLVDALVERGDSVRVLDSLDPQVHGEGATEPVLIRGHVESGRVDFVHGDVTDPLSVERALIGVDTVFHQAAVSGAGSRRGSGIGVRSSASGGSRPKPTPAAPETHRAVDSEEVTRCRGRRAGCPRRRPAGGPESPPGRPPRRTRR